MADKKLIKQIKVEQTVHDIGGSIYNLDEANTSSATDSAGNEIEYLIFYCGNATELIDNTN